MIIDYIFTLNFEPWTGRGPKKCKWKRGGGLLVVLSSRHRINLCPLSLLHICTPHPQLLHTFTCTSTFQLILLWMELCKRGISKSHSATLGCSRTLLVKPSLHAWLLVCDPFTIFFMMKLNMNDCCIILSSFYGGRYFNFWRKTKEEVSPYTQVAYIYWLWFCELVSALCCRLWWIVNRCNQFKLNVAQLFMLFYISISCDVRLWVNNLYYIC